MGGQTKKLELLSRGITFLRSIGLTVVEVPEANGFVCGVRIVEGTLHVAPYCNVSTLLHEAGHISIVPTRFRHLLSDNIDAGIQAMFDQLDQMNLDPDDLLNRAAVQCSDPEATAWAYSAGIAMGLNPKQIILDSEYSQGGAAVRLALEFSAYEGIQGLSHAGMCKQGFFAPKAERYPVMIKWLQDA